MTHQFSLDQLVLQRELHSSSSSSLNLIDVLVLIPVCVTVRCLRAWTQALRGARGCLPCHFFEVHCSSPISRGSLRSRLSFQCLQCPRHLPLCGSGCFVDSRGVVSTETSCPCVGYYRVQLCLQFLHSQSTLCGAESRPCVPCLVPWIAYQFQLMRLWLEQRIPLHQMRAGAVCLATCTRRQCVPIMVTTHDTPLRSWSNAQSLSV